jgi:pimeloyl-ACP methyl ester carboxylesterase
MNPATKPQANTTSQPAKIESKVSVFAPQRKPMIETWLQTLPHGITLSCRACGPRGRPVLLFLHGFPEGAFVWDALLEHFAQPEHGGYRCVAPNLRGYERSSAPPEVKDYRAKFLVQDVLALIDSECGAQTPPAPLAALVAHDWGGAVAWNLANQHPERLAKLVIINSPHPGTFLRELQHNPAQQAASAYMNELIQDDAEAAYEANDFEKLLAVLSAHSANEGAFHRTPSAPSYWLTEQVKQDYRQLWQHGIRGGLNYYRASPLRPPRPGEPAAAAVSLPIEMLRIRRPTLVIWGQQDHALLPCLTEGLEDYIADLTLVPLPQASHWVVHEEPQRVEQEISAFLARDSA